MKINEILILKGIFPYYVYWLTHDFVVEIFNAILGDRLFDKLFELRLKTSVIFFSFYSRLQSEEKILLNNMK